MLKNKGIFFVSIVTGILVILSLVTVFVGFRTGVSKPIDFQWDAAKALTLRINPYLESMHPTGVMEKYQYSQYYGHLDAEQFPSLLFLLVPFTLFSPVTANYIWFFCNLLFSFLFLYFFRKTFLKDISRLSFFFICSMFMSCAPIRFCLKLGQQAIFSAAFWIMSVYFAEKKRSVISGLFLGVSYFKFTFTLPLALFFLYKRWYKEFFISLIPHAILTFVAAWWLGESFISMIIQPIQVSTWLTAEGLIDIGTIIGPYVGNYTILIECVLGLLLVMVVVFSEKGNDIEMLTLLVLSSLIITYHRSYDFFLLVIPFALIVLCKRNNRFVRGSIACITIMVFYVETVLSRMEGFTGTLHDIYFGVLGILYYSMVIYYLFRLLKSKSEVV